MKKNIVKVLKIIVRFLRAVLFALSGKRLCRNKAYNENSDGDGSDS